MGSVPGCFKEDVLCIGRILCRRSEGYSNHSTVQRFASSCHFAATCLARPKVRKHVPNVIAPINGVRMNAPAGTN